MTEASPASGPPPPAQAEISFTLNGRPAGVGGDPTRSLLSVLREDLGLTGVKQGCDREGACGACTVILDGVAVRSCLTPLARVAGRSVITVEGLGTEAQPHPLQTAFLEEGASQCGFCTSGMLLAAKALLDRNPHPSRPQIARALKGNICRCTGYTRIFAAVEKAAERMAGGAEAPEEAAGDAGEESALAGLTIVSPFAAGPHAAVGGHSRREKAWERVSGGLQYVDDLRIPGLLHAAVVRSPHFHARVLAIDAAAALALPGVLRVLTAADMPCENGLGGYSPGEHLLAPVGGKVRMLADPVALVIAESPEAAAAGALAVQVAYEVLPHTFEVTGALEPDAIRIHDSGNLLAMRSGGSGDVAAALERSAVVVSAEYETPFQLQAALEREAAIGYVDEEGRLAVLAGNHQPHWGRDFLSAMLGLPPGQVRVHTPPIGGSFGGRQDVWPLAAAALAVYHMRRPVRLAFSRREVMQATAKGHPYLCRLAAGATAGGELTGLRFEALLNTGAYDADGLSMPNVALNCSPGAYRWRAVDSVAKALYSNGPKAGAWRGFGAPQPNFALECLLDELCQQLDIDPIELRLRNVLDESEPTGIGGAIVETLGYRQVLEAIRPEYRAACARAAEFNANRTDRKRRGAGFSGMCFPKAVWANSQAEVELGLDGVFTVYCSAGEFGQGIDTVFSQLAAEALGVPRSGIRLVNADTALTLDGGVTGASRSTYNVGGAVTDAARRLRAAILGAAAELLDCPPDGLALAGCTVCSGDRAGAGITLGEIAAHLESSGLPRRARGRHRVPPELEPSGRPSSQFMLITGANVAEVEVDLDSGQTQVLKVTAAHDVGRAINPRDCRGQVEGAIMMGVGTALMEEYLPAATERFRDYALPTTADVPEMQVILVEVPSRYGPLGAKGLGEAAVIPTAPAIINALSRAIGARLRTLPATPARILAALSASSRSE